MRYIKIKHQHPHGYLKSEKGPTVSHLIVTKGRVGGTVTNVARPFSRRTRFMGENIGSFHDIWKTYWLFSLVLENRSALFTILGENIGYLHAVPKDFPEHCGVPLVRNAEYGKYIVISPFNHHKCCMESKLSYKH
jgi:hypothetical protein